MSVELIGIICGATATVAVAAMGLIKVIIQVRKVQKTVNGNTKEMLEMIANLEDRLYARIKNGGPAHVEPPRQKRRR